MQTLSKARRLTGTRLAITTGAIGILVLGVAAFVARDRIAEEWWAKSQRRILMPGLSQ